MIQIFCNERGSGKTKKLIEKANIYVREAKGNIVFIDDDHTNARFVDRNIRFVSTDDFHIKGCKCFYGFLCGILSSDYDIEHIYIDGLLSILNCSLHETKDLFLKLSKICNKYNIDMFININSEKMTEIPEFIEEFV
ncbi:hypothetical protein HMPREF1092_00422 [Clostridium thermobutyricum]|uniref:Twitching motility protein PilT n=1 Tax=Clostridium thermobutyricum TaxID=29372 RepID=N9WJG2_9CLOT|nr:hypothetical protein [Clostridium thermobutyricum]ENZ03236.1 hypothetical protein HMPREF1092_00422 [Clostridium thermobutyricum]